MNRFRMLAILFTGISMLGILVMGTPEKIIGAIVTGLGLVPGALSLMKARKQENQANSDVKIKIKSDRMQTRKGREKKTIIQWLLERQKKKPATPEEIRQLELEYEKARLEAGIAHFKAEKRKAKQSPGALGELFGPVDRVSRGSASNAGLERENEKEREEYRRKVLGF